jgi:Enoyl-CoA hydratase/isomerase
VITELDAVLGIIEGDQPKGLVIRSTKPSGFIVGADINEFRGATDPALVQAAIGRANAVVNRLEDKAPTIAVIHGFCLGGGLEIALACKWRIAIDGAKFGFPEVMLWLHPGLGGTARSTHLIDPLQAMTLGQDTRCPESKVAWSHFKAFCGERVGDSSTVEQRTLTPSILVRIQVPQPVIPAFFGSISARAEKCDICGGWKSELVWRTVFSSANSTDSLSPKEFKSLS